jgi:hypothetical protein
VLSQQIVFSDYSLNSGGHEFVKSMTKKMPESSGCLVDEERDLARLECKIHEAVALMY